MMGWYGYHGGMTGWGWAAMTVSTILFWAVLITVGVLIVRALRRGPGPINAATYASAEQLLAERFARGEIDQQEYRDRLATLHEAIAGPSDQT